MSSRYNPPLLDLCLGLLFLGVTVFSYVSPTTGTRSSRQVQATVVVAGSRATLSYADAWGATQRCRVEGTGDLRQGETVRLLVPRGVGGQAELFEAWFWRPSNGMLWFCVLGLLLVVSSVRRLLS